MSPRLAEAPNHYEDVVCPPDQDAVCVCGDRLGDHIEGSAEYAADGNAWCPSDKTTFTLAGGETLDCPDVITCLCGSEVCAQHSDEFVACVDSPVEIHHLDCAYSCRSCAAALGEDRQAEMRNDR